MLRVLALVAVLAGGLVGSAWAEGFNLSEWNGKKIQNIRVFSLTKLMM